MAARRRKTAMVPGSCRIVASFVSEGDTLCQLECVSRAMAQAVEKEAEERLRMRDQITGVRQPPIPLGFLTWAARYAHRQRTLKEAPRFIIGSGSMISTVKSIAEQLCNFARWTGGGRFDDVVRDDLVDSEEGRLSDCFLRPPRGPCPCGACDNDEGESIVTECRNELRPVLAHVYRQFSSTYAIAYNPATPFGHWLREFQEFKFEVDFRWGPCLLDLVGFSTGAWEAIPIGTVPAMTPGAPVMAVRAELGDLLKMQMPYVQFELRSSTGQILGRALLEFGNSETSTGGLTLCELSVAAPAAARGTVDRLVAFLRARGHATAADDVTTNYTAESLPEIYDTELAHFAKRAGFGPNQDSSRGAGVVPDDAVLSILYGCVTGFVRERQLRMDASEATWQAQHDVSMGNEVFLEARGWTRQLYNNRDVWVKTEYAWDNSIPWRHNIG